MKKRTKVLHWFYKLSWKKVMGLGMLALTVAVLPTAMNVALNPTRTRSEAALLPVPEPISDQFEVPVGPPVIYLVDHFFGKTGDAVLIHGENLGGLHEDSWVSLGGKKIDLENLVSWTGNYIEFIVPAEARSGKVEVSILGKRTSTDMMFFVTNENVEAELRLQDNYLKAKEINGGKELLVWILVIRGEGEIKMSPVNGITMAQRKFELPIGEIYEAKLGLPANITSQSSLNLVNLVKIDKNEEMLVGIARGELDNGSGQLLPLQAHPLYVSF